MSEVNILIKKKLRGQLPPFDSLWLRHCLRVWNTVWNVVSNSLKSRKLSRARRGIRNPPPPPPPP